MKEREIDTTKALSSETEFQSTIENLKRVSRISLPAPQLNSLCRWLTFDQRLKEGDQERESLESRQQKAVQSLHEDHLKKRTLKLTLDSMSEIWAQAFGRLQDKVSRIEWRQREATRERPSKRCLVR